MRYQVTITATAVKLLTVEADTQAEAIALAVGEAPGVRPGWLDPTVSIAEIKEKA